MIYIYIYIYGYETNEKQLYKCNVDEVDILHNIQE